MVVGAWLRVTHRFEKALLRRAGVLVVFGFLVVALQACLAIVNAMAFAQRLLAAAVWVSQLCFLSSCSPINGLLCNFITVECVNFYYFTG